MKAVLNNGNICLRAPEPTDLDLLFGIENDTGLWFVSNNLIPYSKYQLEKYIRESAHDILTDRQVRFIVAGLANGTAMGCIDLTDIDVLNGRAEVGIVLLPEWRGRGIAGQALEMLCTYALEMLHLHGLYAQVPKDNAGSLNLFTGQGFTQSGCLKQWIRSNTAYVDVVILQKFF